MSAFPLTLATMKIQDGQSRPFHEYDHVLAAHHRRMYYILGKFLLPRFGIYFTLRNLDSLNFCGMNTTLPSSDSRDLIFQDEQRSEIKRRYRLRYNKLAHHIPYAFIRGKRTGLTRLG